MDSQKIIAHKVPGMVPTIRDVTLPSSQVERGIALGGDWLYITDSGVDRIEDHSFGRRGPRKAGPQVLLTSKMLKSVFDIWIIMFTACNNSQSVICGGKTLSASLTQDCKRNCLAFQHFVNLFPLVHYSSSE